MHILFQQKFYIKNLVTWHMQNCFINKHSSIIQSVISDTALLTAIICQKHQHVNHLRFESIALARDDMPWEAEEPLRGHTRCTYTQRFPRYRPKIGKLAVMFLPEWQYIILNISLEAEKELYLSIKNKIIIKNKIKLFEQVLCGGGGGGHQQ